MRFPRPSLLLGSKSPTANSQADFWTKIQESWNSEHLVDRHLLWIVNQVYVFPNLELWLYNNSGLFGPPHGFLPHFLGIYQLPCRHNTGLIYPHFLYPNARVEVICKVGRQWLQDMF